jgi:hypothetical protein
VPAMKSYSQANRVYFHGFANTRMGSGHWNQRGNCFAAMMIADKLAAMIECPDGVMRLDGLCGSAGAFTNARQATGKH